MKTFRFLSLVALALAGCGDVARDDVDAQSTIDAPPPDAALASPPAPGLELAPGAGRLSGGTWTVDVQLGSIHQTPASGGSWTAHSGAPLNP